MRKLNHYLRVGQDNQLKLLIVLILRIFYIQSKFHILIEFDCFFLCCREVHIDSDNDDQKPTNKRAPFRDTPSNGNIKFLIDKIYLI